MPASAYGTRSTVLRQGFAGKQNTIGPSKATKPPSHPCSRAYQQSPTQRGAKRRCMPAAALHRTSQSVEPPSTRSTTLGPGKLRMKPHTNHAFPTYRHQPLPHFAAPTKDLLAASSHVPLAVVHPRRVQTNWRRYQHPHPPNRYTEMSAQHRFRVVLDAEELERRLKKIFTDWLWPQSPACWHDK